MNVMPRSFLSPMPLDWISQTTRAAWIEQRVCILRQNAEFEKVALEFARYAVSQFETRPAANGAIANAVRYTICTAILASHFRQQQDGPDVPAGPSITTLSSLQALTSEMELCSKNTTAATVFLLERVGLVRRLEHNGDRRSSNIVPTEALISAWRDQLNISLLCADMLFPRRHYQSLIDDPDFVARYFACGIHSIRSALPMFSSMIGSGLFAESDRGMPILWKLMTMPSQSAGVVEFPFDEIAAPFKVSRTHIRRLMKKAEAEGLLTLLEDGGRKIQLLEPLREGFEKVVALIIARAQFDVHLANGDYDLLPFDGRGGEG